MQGLKNSLLWEGFPILLVLITFGFISTLNWGYESKLITPNTSADNWTDAHMGILLLSVAMLQVAIASSILFVVRIIGRRTSSGFHMLVAHIAVFIFLILPSLFIVILGPAAITMAEQMRVMPR